MRKGLFITNIDHSLEYSLALILFLVRESGVHPCYGFSCCLEKKVEISSPKFEFALLVVHRIVEKKTHGFVRIRLFSI